ncbi:hypothetical protein [Methanobacterium petrolearium]|uniref:hypothetical protein n=1 Tax=Methanobacterium petrolearium TaxID=710190 RepID=UPI001AE25742|nr:hypothetical protein [Methanobacterium petrolearium]MBP1945094.1 hypothetical protein [Methanobacterium petrolearium]BDZ71014.1 hypothetical protein GCM10025861_15310 [Methanobacterium petrolearium]
MFLEAVLYALSGFFMKFSDDALDQKDNTLLGVASGLLCVAGIGYLAVNFSDAATIFLAILLGTVLSAKVDKIGHMVTLIVFLVILFIWGIPTIGIITLAICTLAAWLDEVGNDRESFEGKKILETFFNYRCALKITVLILSILGGLPLTSQIPGLNFFQPVTFIYFMLFDLAYELAGLKFDRIYHGLQGIYRVFS